MRYLIAVLMLVSSVAAEDIFKPTGRYAVQFAQRQWYLVSESWCQHCPAARSAFIAKGWPESNILTLDECESRFGFRPDHIPFEFGEPEAKPVEVKPVQIAMSHSEMITLHNRLHGGGQWTWPGDLETHLRTTHGVSTTKTTTPKPTVRTVQQSACPNGRCPTVNRGSRWFGFGRRR